MPLDGQQQAQATSVPAPVGGWNARDSLASMEPTDAIVLDNFIPSSDRVDARKGCSSFATLTGILSGAQVDTLACARRPEESLWAFALAATGGGAIKAWNVTTGGATAADATFTALGHLGTRADYVTAQMTNTAGRFMYACNALGENAPALWDGTNWTTPALSGSGLANALLCHVCEYRFRLFFVQKDTLNLWYLPQDAISGTLKKLPMGGYCKRGGSLIAQATWSVDAGNGKDDIFIAITDKGEVLVFQGADPSSASAWSIVGRYYCAPPIGPHCFMNLGASLMVITTDGWVSIESLFQASLANPIVPLSDKIKRAFQSSAREWGDEPGWMAVEYPRGGYVVINVPQSDYASTSTSKPIHQYVVSTTTRQWCRFTGLSARCWALLNKDLYFGGTDGIVYLADTGYADNAQPIQLRAKQAFNYFGTRGRQKLWTMSRLVLLTDATSVTGAIYIDTDFQAQDLVASGAITANAGATWDSVFWDTTFWDADAAILQEWQTYGGLGYCAALCVGVNTNGAQLSWYATDWQFQLAGLM